MEKTHCNKSTSKNKKGQGDRSGYLKIAFRFNSLIWGTGNDCELLVFRIERIVLFSCNLKGFACCSIARWPPTKLAPDFPQA